MSPVSSCLSHSFDGYAILGCDRIFKVLEALRLASVSVIFPCRLHCFFAAVVNAAEADATVIGKGSSHDSSPTTAASAIEVQEVVLTNSLPCSSSPQHWHSSISCCCFIMSSGPSVFKFVQTAGYA
jgi:hypothetical protein